MNDITKGRGERGIKSEGVCLFKKSNNAINVASLLVFIKGGGTDLKN